MLAGKADEDDAYGCRAMKHQQYRRAHQSASKHRYINLKNESVLDEAGPGYQSFSAREHVDAPMHMCIGVRMQDR